MFINLVLVFVMYDVSITYTSLMASHIYQINEETLYSSITAVLLLMLRRISNQSDIKVIKKIY